MDILRDVQRALEQKEAECGKSFAELIVELALESRDPMVRSEAMELSLQLASDERQTINH